MGLSFLTPMLLGGAALVAVPIVLHLVMRRTPVPHDFPALRFLRERAVANRRRLQLNHLLLLLLRMAALALLAGALARPLVRGAGWLADGEAPVAAAFVFDTAPRMLLREANKTRLEQAAAMAKVLFDKLPDGSTVAVLDTAGGAPAFAPSPAAARGRLDRLAAATPILSLPAAIAAGLKLLAGADRPRRELYVFTDCSHGAWDNAAPLDMTAHPGTSLLFVDVAAVHPQNFAIDEVVLAADQVPAGTPLSLSAAISRTGPDATRSVAVELLMPDGRYARRGAKNVSWRQGDVTQVDFDIQGLEVGTRQGRVMIEGSDDLDADNVRAFTVAVGPPAQVIVAAPDPAARTGLFVAQAIAPAGLGQPRFDLKTVTIDQLDDASWADARGIVLVDPPPLPPRTWEALENWVAEGRGLVAWLGPRAGTPEAFNSDAAESLLGGRIVRVWRSAAADNYIAPAALDHPILAAFRRVGDAVPWQDFPVTRHWEFAAGPAAEEGAAAAEPPATVVAAYRDGLPAVLEHRVGRGRVVIVTTPVSQAGDDPDAWNMLATGFEPWPFVMLANETLLHAIDTAADRNVVAGVPAVLQIDRRDVAAAFVKSPAGDEFPAAVDQKRGTITVTATQQPGNYAVRAGGEANGVAVGFSANLAPAATDFSRVSAEDLAAAIGPGARLARSEEELVRDVNLERIGTELYGWVILLAALAMAGDWIVANRFYTSRDDTTVARPAADFAAAAEVADAAGPQAGPVPPPVPPAPPPVPADSRPVPPPLPPVQEIDA